MASQKSKTRYLDINVKETSFVSRFIGSRKEAFNFSDISLLRKLLSNEKAKILYTLKNKKPKSIYNLAKILGRDFKSVSQDVKLLEKFGFIELKKTSTGKRQALTPELAVSSINLVISV